MANLVEQMEILRGLSDQQLAAEMRTPSGGAAPFMVATEISRRKDMRDRYMAEAARRQPSKTTVVEDVVASMPPVGMMPGAPQPGIAGAMGQPMGGGMPPQGMPPAAPGIEGYASGGVVGDSGLDYGALMQRYNDRLQGLDSQRDRAAALALIAAGAGMMGGGSSNTLRNIGTGVGAGLEAYRGGLDAVTAQEDSTLRSLADLQEAQLRAANSRASAASMSLSPIFLSDGKTVKVGQMSPQGGVMIDGKLYPGVPEGMTVVNRPQGYEFRDTGLAIEAFNPNLGPEGATATPVAPIDVSGKAFDTKLGTDLGEQVATLRTKASEAKQSLEANNRTLELLDNGIISGFGADFRLGFGKALQAAGFNANKDEIANTEAFIATRAQEVGRLIQLFGAGTGLSDADREYAEKAAAGTIELTEDSIRRIIEINNRAAANVIARYDAIAADLGDRGSIPESVIGGSGGSPPAAAPAPATAGDPEIDALVEQYSTP